MDNLRKIISTNIINLRKVNELTQIDLSKKVNYSDKAISRWEKGEVVPDVETLEKLSKIFNVPLTYFFEEHSTLINKKSKKVVTKNDLLLLLSIIFIIWTIVSIGFVYAQLFYNYTFWQIFVWGVPTTCCVAIYFNYRWHKRIGIAIWKSLLNWSLITSFYLQFIELNAWLIFIIGIPIQASIIITSLKTPKNKKGELNNEL